MIFERTLIYSVAHIFYLLQGGCNLQSHHHLSHDEPDPPGIRRHGPHDVHGRRHEGREELRGDCIADVALVEGLGIQGASFLYPGWLV